MWLALVRKPGRGTTHQLQAGEDVKATASMVRRSHKVPARVGIQPPDRELTEEQTARRMCRICITVHPNGLRCVSLSGECGRMRRLGEDAMSQPPPWDQGQPPEQDEPPEQDQPPHQGGGWPSWPSGDQPPAWPSSAPGQDQPPSWPSSGPGQDQPPSWPAGGQPSWPPGTPGQGQPPSWPSAGQPRRRRGHLAPRARGRHPAGHLAASRPIPVLATTTATVPVRRGSTRRRPLRGALIGLVLFIVFGFIVRGVTASHSAVSITPFPSASGLLATGRTEPPGRVGAPFVLQDGSGDTYQVALVKVIDPARGADQFTSPDSGKRFVGLVFKVRALTGSPHNEDANNDAVLVGGDGQNYSADFDGIAGYTNFDSGTIHVAQGDTVTGAVTFQIPNGITVSKVQWSALSGFGVTAQWDVRG